MTRLKISGRVWNSLRAAAALCTLLFSGTLRAPASQLSGETQAAFERYVQSSEMRMERELAGEKVFLAVDSLGEPRRSEAYGALRSGQVLIGKAPEIDPSGSREVRGGLIHNWTGTVFIPGSSMEQVLALLQDYDRDSEYYTPQIVKSKLLEHSGDEFRIFLRLKQVHGITVVLDTEYDVRYKTLDTTHATSYSYSTSITEVENAGQLDEHQLRDGDDHGFLWRLYSYWRFYQANGGVYVQCNAISLTRDVPLGLGWLVRPFIENIPRESLRITLEATRKAVLDNLAREN